jgi:hypothetical protein
MKRAPMLALANSSPLLEEEWHAGRAALSLDGYNPLAPDGPRAGTALAAHNHPVDGSQIDGAEVLEQRLDRQESYSCICLSQVPNSRKSNAPVLNAYAPPDVWGARH